MAKGVTTDRVIEGVIKASKDKKEALCKANNISLEELNEQLTYKAIVPSENSKPVQKLEESVEKILNSLDSILLKTVSKEDLPRLKNVVLENVKSNFFNKGCYSEAHFQSLIAKGALKDAEPAGKASTASKSKGEVVEW